MQQDVSHAGAADVLREAVKLASVTYHGLTGKEALNQKMPDRTTPDPKAPCL